jgi:hypothetical protein
LCIYFPFSLFDAGPKVLNDGPFELPRIFLKLLFPGGSFPHIGDTPEMFISL